MIVGAGPAGLLAALGAARSGSRVTLCERQPGPARKLLVSGGGRCNVTNVLDTADFIARWGRSGRFLTTALRAFGRDALLQFLRDHGAPCHAADGFHYFPEAERSSAILRACLNALAPLGVAVRTHTAVEALMCKDGALAGAYLAPAGASAETGGALPADAVILAAGGLTYPAVSGTTAGYELARQAGHTVVDPVPALVGLRTVETWPGECAGVALERATACVDLPQLRRVRYAGPLLFTHQGVSGPVILDLSGAVSRLLPTTPRVPLRLNLTPDETASDWDVRLTEWQRTRGTRTVRNLVGTRLPHSLAEAACAACAVAPALRASVLPRPQRLKLADWITGAPLTVDANEGVDKAMVTSGGVALAEVHAGTLESRLVRGLFFAGEVLDLDGPCGGFNLQWAFSSGWLAGSAQR